MATMQDLRELPLVNSGVKKTRTICGYCGVGCSVDILTKNDRIVGIQPAMDGPANLGALCIKGQFAYDYVHQAFVLTRDRFPFEAWRLIVNPRAPPSVHA